MCFSVSSVYERAHIAEQQSTVYFVVGIPKMKTVAFFGKHEFIFLGWLLYVLLVVWYTIKQSIYGNIYTEIYTSD